MSARPDRAEEDRLRRLHELRFWLRGHGCCWLCALRFALAQLEKEAGLKFEAGSQCAADSQCADKARAAWPKLPAAPEQKAA